MTPIDEHKSLLHTQTTQQNCQMNPIDETVKKRRQHQP